MVSLSSHEQFCIIKIKQLHFYAFLQKNAPNYAGKFRLPANRKKAVHKELPFSEISTIGEILFTFSS